VASNSRDIAKLLAAAARPDSGREYGDAATAMATGSEGAEAGAGESAGEAVATQFPPEVWATMSRAARQHANRLRRKGAYKQNALSPNSRDQSGK